MPPTSFASSDLPKVSVYIPTHNRGELLLAAVRSAQSQDWPKLEILITDDGSTDDTPVRLAELAATDSRVKVFRHAAPRGACAARNTAIRAATGDFVTGLDDDDEFRPGHVRALVEHWQFLERLGVAFSCLFVQDLWRTGDVFTETSKSGSVQAEEMFARNQVGNQVFARRQTYLDAGLFDEEMPAWQDLEFFYRLLKTHGVARLLDWPGYVFDHAPRSDRISVKQKARIQAACERMFAKHGEGQGRRKQRLLLQLHSEHYGFPISWSEVAAFARLGLWPTGLAQLISMKLRRRN